MDQAYSMERENFKHNLEEVKLEYDKILEAIDECYADEEHTYIIQSITDEKIETIEESITLYKEDLGFLEKIFFDLKNRDQKKYTVKMEEKEIENSVETFTDSISDIQTKKEMTKQLNDFFVQDYMNGTKVYKDVHITDDLHREEFEKIQKEMKGRLKEAELNNAEKFSKRLTEGFEIAEEQLEHNHRATELANELFNENGFLIDPTEDKIRIFQELVEEIKNPVIQRNFDEKIRITESYQPEEEPIEEVESTDSEESNNTRQPTHRGQTNWNSQPEAGQSNNNTSNSESPGKQESYEGSVDSNEPREPEESEEPENPENPGVPDESEEENLEESPGAEDEESAYNEHHESQR